MTSDILDALEDLDDDDLDFDVDDEVSDELEVVSDDDELAMSADRAREITEAIRAAATATFVLLAEAHAKQAHKALGYKTWAEYVQTEFDMSAQRSYQLLDLSRVVSEIEAVVPEGTEVKLTEAQARDIKRELPRVTEKIRESTEDLDPKASADEVDRIINEIREQRKADDKAMDAHAKAADEARQEGYQAALEASADAILENADGPSSSSEVSSTSDEASPSDDSASPEDAMNLYNFFNGLSAFTSLPEPDEFIRVIPKDRVPEISAQLLDAVAWINRFQTLWEVEYEE